MIAGKTWREIRWMALAYLLVLELLAVPVILLWPEIYPDLQRSTLLRNPGMDWVKRIGDGVGNRDEDIAYRAWCAIMLFFRSTNLVCTAGAVLLGTGLFAREREAQTLEFLLARPVSRGRILWQKTWPAAIALVVPIFLVNTSAIWWSGHIDMELPFAETMRASMHAAAFTLFFLAATTWVSVKCRVQAHVAAWVGAVAVLQIGVYLTQRIRPYSLFRLVDFDWYGPLLAGNLPLRHMFDPTAGPAFTTWLLLGAGAFWFAAWRALRRLEP